MNKFVDKAAKVLAAVGALNWGTAKVLNFDVLSFIPAGMWTTVTVIAIAASGGYLAWEIYKKRV